MHSALAQSPRACSQTLARGCFCARATTTSSSVRALVMLVPPALLYCGRYIGHLVPLHTAYLIYRISLPTPAFRGVVSSPLRTAFSIGVASSCANVKPNNSALPLSVNTSVALAICVLDMGFDGRDREGERNEDKLGGERLLRGVDGRGCVLRIFGGCLIFATVVTFSLFTGGALGRGGSIWSNEQSGTASCCFRLGGRPSPKSERKAGSCRGGWGRTGVVGFPSNCGNGLFDLLIVREPEGSHVSRVTAITRRLDHSISLILIPAWPWVIRSM